MVADHVQKMHHAVTENQSDIAIASCHDRAQPVYALINRSLSSSLQTFLASGQRKIDRWYVQHKHTIVDFSDTPQMFENINTPETVTGFRTHSEIKYSRSRTAIFIITI